MNVALGRHALVVRNSPQCLRHIRARQAMASIAHNTARSNSTRSGQAIPFQGYYQDMLDTPLHSTQHATKIPPAPLPKGELPKTEKEERLAKARVVFGSRLAGPGERQKKLDEESRVIAGVKVPPKPLEPDNCCMSGCVNCVWDQYRDELEEWAAASTKARSRMIAQRTSGAATGMMAKEKGSPSHVAISMDDDGGGSETNWIGEENFGDGLEDASQNDLFKDIPVGIREFMKTEKRLKEMHQKTQTVGG